MIVHFHLIMVKKETSMKKLLLLLFFITIYRDYAMNDAILLDENDTHKNKIKAINETYLT